MQNLIIPSFSEDSSKDLKKLLSYVEDVRINTESRLTYIENQLTVIKQILEGGEI